MSVSSEAGGPAVPSWAWGLSAAWQRHRKVEARLQSGGRRRRGQAAALCVDGDVCTTAVSFVGMGVFESGTRESHGRWRRAVKCDQASAGTTGLTQAGVGSGKAGVWAMRPEGGEGQGVRPSGESGTVIEAHSTAWCVGQGRWARLRVSAFCGRRCANDWSTCGCLRAVRQSGFQVWGLCWAGVFHSWHGKICCPQCTTHKEDRWWNKCVTGEHQHITRSHPFMWMYPVPTNDDGPHMLLALCTSDQMQCDVRQCLLFQISE